VSSSSVLDRWSQWCYVQTEIHSCLDITFGCDLTAEVLQFSVPNGKARGTFADCNPYPGPHTYAPVTQRIERVSGFRERISFSHII